MFAYDDAVAERYPTVRAGVIHATGLANGPSSPGLLDGYRVEQNTEAASLGTTTGQDRQRREVVPGFAADYRVSPPAYEFGRQPEESFAARKAKDPEGSLLAVPGKHHYDVLDGFLDAESTLCSAILRRMGIV